eukprot:11185867-Lingulodinium_polyedra.AAC.1
MAGWPNIARCFLDFVSKAVFSHGAPFLNGFQQIAKTSGSVLMLLSQAVFQEVWEQITTCAGEEA